MCAAVGQVEAVVRQALFLHSRVEAEALENIGRRVLEHAGADSSLDVVPALALDDDGFDTSLPKQVPEHQACGSGADDGDLCFHAGANPPP